MSHKGSVVTLPLSLYVSPIHGVIMFSVIREVFCAKLITLWQFVDQFGQCLKEVPPYWVYILSLVTKTTRCLAIVCSMLSSP